jgi:hypothetical protein
MPPQAETPKEGAPLTLPSSSTETGAGHTSEPAKEARHRDRQGTGGEPLWSHLKEVVFALEKLVG